MQGLIKKEGLRLDIAENGQQGLVMLQQSLHQPYVLILMDCLMPELDGFETTRQIRAGTAGDRYRQIPIIALTANAMKKDREHCLAVGMDDYLSKPVNPKIFKEKLTQYLQPFQKN